MAEDAGSGVHLLPEPFVPTSGIEKFCQEELLDVNKTFNAAFPEISQCFQHTVLSWVPCAFLLILTPFLMYKGFKSKQLQLRWTPLLIAKLVLSALLTLITLVLLITQIVRKANEPDIGNVWIVYPVILCVAMADTFYILLLCQRSGFVTSGVLFISWVLFFIGGLPELLWWGQKFNEPDQIKSVKIPFFIYYTMILVQLVLSCIADKALEYSEIDKEKECPEFKSSFLNQLTFWWFTAMAKIGHKRPLIYSDLWVLNDRDVSKTLVPQFQAIWGAALRKYQKKKAAVLEQHARLELNGEAEEKTPLLSSKKKEKEGPKLPSPPSILRCLFDAYRPTWLAAMVLKVAFDCMQFISPQIQKWLLNFVQDPSAPLWRGIFFAVLLFATAFVQSMMLHQYFQRMFYTGMNIKTVLTSAVFKKTLKLSNAARKDKTVGEIVNLIAVDVERFQTLTTFAMQFISAPLQIVLALYFLWDLLGPAVLGGFAILVIMIPVNFLLSHLMRQYQIDQMKYKDERIKTMNEILSGMKVLKLYAWEPSMEKLVGDIRAKEIYQIKKIFYLDAVMTFSWAISPFLVTVISFAAYVLVDPNNKLTPEITFVALSLFNILRIPMSLFGMMIARAVQVYVSNKRLKSYLIAEDLDPTTVQRLAKQSGPEPAIKIRDGTFSWERTAAPNLKDINLTVDSGKLIAVVGKVGSGKTSLISSMLGEMDKLSGHVTVQGTVSYVAQQAWIQNMSLKDNITFGKPLNEKFYQKVVNACSLKSDFATLPGGDETEIGEKGINLSGGQKQRVSLARAIYQDRDIYLFDDPLSAVDSHVGKHIFDYVVSDNGMLKGKTRVLVTHGLTYLKDVDQIVVIRDGRISESGSYDQLMKSKGAFAEFLEEHLLNEARQEKEDEEGAASEDVDEILDEIEKYDPSSRKRLETQLSQFSSGAEGADSDGSSSRKRKRRRSKSRQRVDSQLSELSHVTEGDSDYEKRRAILRQRSASTIRDRLITGDDLTGEEQDEKSKLIETETTETGRVKSLVYLSYIKAIGYIITFSFFLVYIIATGLDVGSNLWLANWSDDQAKVVTNDTHFINTATRLGVYGTLGVGHAGFVLISGILLAIGMVLAGIRLHHALLHNILRSPMSFFDVTPTGRILNRFSKDVDSVDIIIPLMMTELVMCIFEMLASLFVVLYSLPIFAVIVIPVIIMYLLILRFYVSTSRQLKRIESVTRSPIYSHLQEIVHGAPSIRAYNVTQRFIEESEKRVDYNLTSFYPNICANRWLAVRLEFVGNCIVFFVALFAVLFRNNGTLTAGLVGLCVTYSLNITSALNVAVRILSELETNIVSVERMKEYSETPTEAEWESEPAYKPPVEWPDQGVVQFDSYATRYREGMDLVLDGINANISPSEKVGIVGRTGAGKSSLTLTLFRIIEAAQGKIVIDGRDISKMGLHDLRSKLTIIPQEPVLFSGSLRMNLDPFSRYSDDEIWRALEHSYLKEFTSEKADKLEYIVNEGGENLSVGQRQLLCLARALLRKTKVLILDEATAAIDVETDALIQKTIRTQFADCTILTIAHRLNTILDSDRVMVLDQGKIKEFANPDDLLADQKSEFYSMAKDANIVG